MEQESLIETGGSEGSETVKQGVGGRLSAHGVTVARLAHEVLSDPNATVREAVLAGWILRELEGRRDE